MAIPLRKRDSYAVFPKGAIYGVVKIAFDIQHVGDIIDKTS